MKLKSLTPFVGKSVVATAILSLSAYAHSGVIWSENFDSATPGQSVAASPINWTAVAGYGNVVIGSSPHPGWQGNGIVGSLSTSPAEGAWATANLPSIPTTGVVSLEFDAWAFSNYYYGAEVTIRFAGEPVYITAWNNGQPGIDDVWYVYNAGQYVYLSPTNFMRDRTVHVTFTADYTDDLFWVSFDDGVSVVTTQSFAFTGAPITTLSVWEDKRINGFGADFDNFTVTAGTAVPEPAPALLLAIGLPLLTLATKKRRVAGT